MKRKIVIGIVVLAVAVLISGASLLAFAAPGTQADPFVTLSYLTEIFRPQVMSEVEAIERELVREFEARIAVLESQLEAGQGGAQAAPAGVNRFSVITLRNGQTLTGSVGTEIMLRIGTASGAGTAPALVNYTTGSAISDGDALAQNHMYLVTIEGNGIRATAETVRVLVRGSYRVA